MNDPYRQDHEKNANITLTCPRQLFVRWPRAPPRRVQLGCPRIIPRHCLAQLPQRANTSVYTTEHCRKAPSPHLQWPLYYRSLSKAMPRFLLNGKMSQMLLCYFCGGHRSQRLPVPRGPRTPQKVYIPERRFVLPFVLFRSSHFLTSSQIILCQYNSQSFSLPTLPIHHGALTLRNQPAGAQRRSQCWKKNLAYASRRRPRLVSVRQLPFSSHSCSKSYSSSVGLPPKLRILPPRRKKSTTQAPVPRPSLSYLNGPCETLWACDEDGVTLIESVESPLEGSFPDLLGDQDSELDHDDVATPTNGNPWSSDEELTPLFFSNFPNTLDPSALSCEGHPDGKLLEPVHKVPSSLTHHSG